jgi:hypothetical protein
MEAVRGGMWVALADGDAISVKTDDDGGRYAQLTFFGSFEVSLSMSEQAIAQCRDVCAEALREMRAVGDDSTRSWMHRAAPSE